MPPVYDIKAIGDQLHRLTLELEVEKLITDTILRRLSQAEILSQQVFNEILDNLPQAKDADGEKFTALYHSRLLAIHTHLGAPPSLGD